MLSIYRRVKEYLQPSAHNPSCHNHHVQVVQESTINAPAYTVDVPHLRSLPTTHVQHMLCKDCPQHSISHSIVKPGFIACNEIQQQQKNIIHHGIQYKQLHRNCRKTLLMSNKFHSSVFHREVLSTDRIIIDRIVFPV